MSIRADNPNLAPLLKAAELLAPILDQIAFVGGCATGLLVSDPAAAPVRATFDVDAIIEIASYTEFIEIEQRLAHLGFRRDPAALICRWFADDLILDLMPTEAGILGFTNRWYRPALENAQLIRIGEIDLRHITAPYFLATKVEAFHGRGKDDYAMSHDLEDIITVIDGRAELTEEVAQASRELRQYLATEFRSLMASRGFRDALPGHLLPDSASQQRIGIVTGRIQQIIDLG